MSCFENIMLNLSQKLETKRNQVFKHEFIKQNIKAKDMTIFFITKKFVKQRERYEEAKLADSLNKVMYAVVKDGTRWRKFKKFSWRKIYYFSECKELNQIMRQIIIDISLIRAVGGR